MRAKTIIIGGGAVGLSIALHSARRRDSLQDPVMLLERGELGSGPAARSVAVLHQFHGSKNVAGMARDSLRYYRGIENKTGRAFGFVQTGVLTLAKSRAPKDHAKLRELVQMQESIGIDVTCVDAPAMRKLINGLEIHDDSLGAWEPKAACIDSNLTLQALATLARNRGAIIRSQTAVERIVTESGRVVAVETSDGTIDCDQIVVASGPWGRSMLSSLGVDLPLQGVRAEYGYLASTVGVHPIRDLDSAYALAGLDSVRRASENASPRNSFDGASVEAFGDQFEDDLTPLRADHPVLIDSEKGFYVRSDPLHGRAVIGRRGREGFRDVQDPDDFVDDVGAGFMDWARQVLESRLPQYADVQEVGAECGLFTMTPDNRPALGALRAVKGLYIACAFSGHSFTLAPSVGEGMAQMLSAEPVSAFDINTFSPERFSQLEIPKPSSIPN